MHLIHYPVYVPPSQYDAALAKMVDKLKGQPGAVSIYQLGSVSTPGVSDIDMLVLFEKGAECHVDPLADLSRTERYLFAHSPYGATFEDFTDILPYTIFHHYRHVWGTDPLRTHTCAHGGLPDRVSHEMKLQIALEYLLKMYVNVTVERTLGIIKLRSLLLLVRALRYDLDLLEVNGGRLFELVEQIIDWRARWFDDRPQAKAILAWHDKFYSVFHDTLSRLLGERPLYIPEQANLNIARNMRLEKSPTLGCKHVGFVLPSCLGWLGKKYINIQYRFNRFTFKAPFASEGMPPLLLDRFILTRRMNDYNNKHIPHFLLPAPTLNIF